MKRVRLVCISKADFTNILLPKIHFSMFCDMYSIQINFMSSIINAVSQLTFDKK